MKLFDKSISSSGLMDNFEKCQVTYTYKYEGTNHFTTKNYNEQ